MVSISGNVQAGRKVGDDVASSPCAKQRNESASGDKAVCLKPVGLEFAGGVTGLERGLPGACQPPMHPGLNISEHCHLKLTEAVVTLTRASFHRWGQLMG